LTVAFCDFSNGPKNYKTKYFLISDSYSEQLQWQKKKYSGKLVINVTMKNANLHIFFNFKDLR